MSWSTVCVQPALSTKLVVLFFLVWPFVAAALMARRGKSAAPIAAGLVPLALGVADAWLGLVRVTEGMAVSGGGEHAMAAGIAESLMMIAAGGVAAFGVWAFGAIRRHRPFLDRMSAALLAGVTLDAVGAFVMASRLRDLAASAGLILAAVAAIIAVLAMIWTFRTGRGRVSSAAIPFGVVITATVFVALIAITWTLVDGYRDFAMGRG